MLEIPEITFGKPALVLAPMDGITNWFMRDFLTRMQPWSYCVTEFLRVSNDIPPVKVFHREVPELITNCVTSAGVPVQVQLLGGNPERLALTAERAIKLGAKGVDLNFGCPAPTVNKHDGGATLLKYPERIKEIVSAVRSAVPPQYPVSAKLRLGWECSDDIYRNAQAAEAGGASWITIHGRTKAQGYKPPADWRRIGKTRAMLSVPVVANGDISTLEDLRRCQDETGCTHFMIGRGALAEPGFLSLAAKTLNLPFDRSTKIFDDDIAVWRLLFKQLALKGAEYGDSELKTLCRIKLWLNLASRAGVVSWFGKVKRAASLGELFDLMDTESGLTSCKIENRRCFILKRDEAHAPQDPRHYKW